MWLIKELFVGKAHESVIVIISCIISYFQQCISFALWTGWWSSFKFNVQLFLHINKGISNELSSIFRVVMAEGLIS